MKFIEFNKDKCDSCYKCLRVCPTKAISFNLSDRKIIDSLCIKCGLCESSCPQEALTIRSQTDEVLSWIRLGEQVSVSIAPSFVGAFGLKDPTHMAGVLRKIGFINIEETAVGAEIIASHYDQVIHNYAPLEHETVSSFITSCCPSANYLVEEYYPTLIPHIIPVVSPMIAHGRLMKKHYGTDHKIVFIGPCLAKMAEAEEIAGAIDAVITFEELEHMMKQFNLDLSQQESSHFDGASSIRGCSFPLGGSLREKSGQYREDKHLRYIHVDGIENCMKILDELSSGVLKQCVIELNSCAGSCVNGPDMPKNKLQRYERELYMRNYIESKKETANKERATNEVANEVTKEVTKEATREATKETTDVERSIQWSKDIPFIESSLDISRRFTDKQLKQKEPNKDEIKQILVRMGKFSKSDELNCGACGYKTCDEKSRAVFHGYSDSETCLPYLRKKAESMQSIMIENSPNVVCVIDKNLTIIEVNPSFLKLFNPELLPTLGMPIEMYITHPIFQRVMETQKTEYNQTIFVQENSRHFIMNIIYLDESERMIAFMTDITQEMDRQEEFSRVKNETLLKTQEVIDKQMRVAQEIASLLGETTAETKMSLLSLKKLVMNDRGVY